MDKIMKTNSCFHVKLGTTRKVQFPYFRGFWLVLTKFSFWDKDLAQAIMSYLLLIIKLPFTYGESKSWLNIKKV